MERQRALVIFKGTVFEARKSILAASKCAPMPNHRRCFLENARDNLHSTCEFFENEGGAELHEDLYLPLFDALAVVTDALRFPVRANERMVEALCLMDTATADLADPSCVGGRS